jgi:tetratricopeptide (TPR) repeat protein
MLRHKNFNPTYHESSVAATYEAAFCKLEEDEPDAAQLFSLLSFFDPEHVSTDILTDNADQIGSDNPLLQVLKYSLNFERSVSQLRQLSVQRFTRRPEEPRALWIHDLVQEMYRDRMAATIQTECLELALTLLHSCFPEELLEMSDPATWKNYEKCLPHVIAGIKHANNLDARSVRFARLCRDAGWFLYHKGQYDRAIELTTMSIPLIEQHYGTDDDEYISAVNLLAAANHTKGYHKVALKWYFKVLEYRQKKYGQADTTTNTMHNIALCYHEASELIESQRRFEEIVSYWTMKYGPDHKSTLCSEMSMARNLRYQGSFALAEDLLRKCRTGLLRECGPQHIWSLLSLSELASAIWRRDHARYEEAETMHRQALAEKIEQIGEEHVHTWDSYGDLGYMIWKCDPSRKLQAEELMMKALRPYVETLTVNHPQTREFYDYLAEFYRETNQLEKLESMKDKFGTPAIPSPLIFNSQEQNNFVDENGGKLERNALAVGDYKLLEVLGSTSGQQHDASAKPRESSSIDLRDEVVPLEGLFPDVKSLPDPEKSTQEKITVPVSSTEGLPSA